MSQCVICHRHQDDERMACAVCQVRMDDQLRDIVEFYALAEGELVPGSGGGGRSTETSIGVRIVALDFVAGNDAVAVLASWEADWRETYGLSISPMLNRPEPLLSRSVAFLRMWLQRACEDFTPIDDFARELRECWAIARSAARMAPHARWGIECPADDDRHEDGLCHARIPVDAEESKGQVQCRRCRTVWDVGHLMHVAIATTHIWADCEAAAGYFAISMRDLARIAKSAGIDPSHGRYDMHALYDAMQQGRMTGYARLARVIADT